MEAWGLGTRPYPADERPNDLVHWQTRMTTASAAGLARVRAAHVRLVSPGIVDVPPAIVGFDHAVTLRDVDSHVIELVEP